MPFDGSKKPNTAYWFGEYGNLEWDPTCYNCMYSPVGSELWYSEDGGASWVLVNDFGGEKIISVKVSPATQPDLCEPQAKRLAVARAPLNRWRSNLGIGFSDARRKRNNNNQPIYLDVDGTNPDKLWCVLTGNQNGYKSCVLRTRVKRGRIGRQQPLPASGLSASLTSAAPTAASTLAPHRLSTIAMRRWTTGCCTTQLAHDQRVPSCKRITAADTSAPPAPAACTRRVLCAFGGVVGLHGRPHAHQPRLAVPGFAHHFGSARCLVRGHVHVGLTGGALLEDADAEAWVAYETEVYPVTLTVTDANGNSDTWTWEGMIEVVNEPVVPESGLSEDFNGLQFPPANWRMEVNGHAWEHAWDLVETETGGPIPELLGQHRGRLRFTHHTGVRSHGLLGVTFDVAHQVYASYVDGLKSGPPRRSQRVDRALVSLRRGIGCGRLLHLVLVRYGRHRSVGQPQHRTASGLDGGAETCLEVAFVNVGGYGNHTWIDNVNILGQMTCSSKPSCVRSCSQSERRTLRPHCPCNQWGRRIASTTVPVGKSGPLTQPRTELDLGLPAGVYHLQVEGMGGVKWAIR